MNNSIYILSKFEYLSFELIDFINKLEEVVFVFEDSEIIDFETRKNLLLFNLNDKNPKIIKEKEFKNIKTSLSDLILKDPEKEFPSKFIEIKAVDVPDNYLNYILDHHLFKYDEIYQMMSEKRYKHSVSVAKTALDIARSNKINPNKAFIAAILHDIAKDISREKEASIMAKYYHKHLNESEVVYHQFVGAYLAKKLFKIHDKTILDAIKYHTTGNKKMSEVAKIVYCSDKIEPTRGYDSQFMIDACKKDINSGFDLVLDENVKYLVKAKVNLDEGLSKTTVNYYMKKERYKEILKNE